MCRIEKRPAKDHRKKAVKIQTDQIYMAAEPLTSTFSIERDLKFFFEKGTIVIALPLPLLFNTTIQFSFFFCTFLSKFRVNIIGTRSNRSFGGSRDLMW